MRPCLGRLAAASSRQLPPSFVAVSPCWSAVAVPALQPAVCLGRLAAASSRQLPPSFVAVSPCWSAVAVPALQPAVCLHIASVALPRPHCRQTPPQGHRNGSRAPHGRSNGFFYRLPFAKPQTLQTFQLLQKFAQLRREKAPHGRSNGFFYRRSRLPFARPQTFQTLHTLDKSAQLRREKVPQQAQHAPLPHAKRPTSQASLCC